MAIDQSPNNEKIHSIPHISNMGFDYDLQAPFVLNAGYDGVGIQRPIAESMAVKMTEVGDVTYIAIARPGTSEATDKWQVKKLDQSAGLVITWADGDADFNNVATDLTALTYS